tara:strand:+ start:149 stop:583 length:435 start_codon:yes stop_codon:yes gene_type:complete
MLAFCSKAYSITDEMHDRAKKAGEIIQYEHDPKRTYLANDHLALDTNIEYSKALRYTMSANWEKTTEIYLKIANRGHPIAQVHLGKQYVHGNGVKLDFVEAYKWFKLSEQGIASHFMEVLREDMTDEEILKAEKLADEFVGSYY